MFRHWMCQCGDFALEDILSPYDVIVNIYDIISVNVLLGGGVLGIYHSGIQVHGIEIGYGRALGDGSGVHVVEPRECPVHTYRTSVLLGRTKLTSEQVCELIDESNPNTSLPELWLARNYHLLRNNCNHFSEVFADLLLNNGTGRRKTSFPSWINRLARSGVKILPRSLVEKLDKQDADAFYKMAEDDDAFYDVCKSVDEPILGEAVIFIK